MNSVNDIVKKLRENRILNERENYSKKSREELIQMAQDGDHLAIETLINMHQDFIQKMSYKYFTDSGDREDIIQAATIAFWDAVMSWNGKGDFEAYAGMIIKRKMTDELRKDSSGKAEINNQALSLDADMMGRDVSTNDDEDDRHLKDRIPSKKAGTTSPEEEFLGREGAREITRYMRDTFSQAERDVIMRYIKGYKVSEIAEETGMKYKSVENALMRAKNKLTDFLRTRESKKIRESNEVVFTDEEKQILKSVITKVNKYANIRETRVQNLKESYDNYTESQLDDELDSIEYDIEEIVDEMKETYYDNRDNLLDRLDDLRSKLIAMEEYLSEDQYKKSEDLMDEIGKAEETEYDGPTVHRDPYTERGLHRSDFY